MRATRMALVVLVFVALSLALPAGAWAVTYHVSKSGSDLTGTGSSTAPFLTIGKALTVVADSDTIRVGAGTFNENLTIANAIAVDGSGPTSTIIRGTHTRSVIAVDTTGPMVIINNVQITNGDAVNGGGIESTGTVLSMYNTKITGNTADQGGAVYIASGGLAASACTFSKNLAIGTNGVAGAIAVVGSATLNGCTVAENDANKQVAGVAIRGSSATFTNCSFRSNNSLNSSFDTLGGAAWVNAPNLTVSGCSFADNSADTGAGLIVQDVTNGTITGCTFSGNHATMAGALYADASSVTISRNRFMRNAAMAGAAGVYISGGPSVDVVDNLFVGNLGTLAPALFSNATSTLRVVNNTASLNVGARAEGGVFMAESAGSATFTNGIIWGNTGEAISGFTVAYSDIEDPNVTGTGVTHANPQFVDPVGGDFEVLYPSPVIDTGAYTAGATDTDLAGVARPLDGDRNGSMVYDMGCFERPYMGLASGATTSSKATVGIGTKFPGATKMRIDLGRGYSAWRTVATPIYVYLPGNDGTKRVRVQYQFGGSKTIVLTDDIVVNRPPYVMSAPSVSPSTIKRGTSTSVSGTVRSRVTSTILYVYKKSGSQLTLVKSVTAKATAVNSTTSKYSAKVKLTVAGSYVIKAYQPANNTHESTLSTGTNLTVK